MTFDQAQSPRLGQRAPVESTFVQIFDVDPETPTADLVEAAWPGQLIFRQDRSILQIYDAEAGAWADVAGGVAGQLTYVGPSMPTGSSFSVGDVWYDSSTSYTQYVWDGDSWEPVSAVDEEARDAAEDAQETADGAQTDADSAAAAAAAAVADADAAIIAAGTAQSAAITAQASAATAQAAADIAGTMATASNKVFRQAAPPTSGGGYTLRTGDTWYETDNGNFLRVWDGDSWETAQDTAIPANAAAAAAAQATATTASTNASTAIAAAGTAQSTADGKVRSFFQNDPPTGLVAGDVGDMWFDTNDGNKLYQWTGSAWLLAQDQGIATAITAAGNASTLAGTKIITFYQTGIPTALAIGDLWVDTDDGNKLYRAEAIGSNEITAGEWVSVQDTSIAAAAASASAANTAATQALTAAQTAQATADGAVRTYYQSSAPNLADAVRNLATNPSVETASTKWGVNGAPFSLSRVAAGDAVAGGWVHRGTVTATAVTSTSGPISYGTSTNRMLANPGDACGMRISLRTNPGKTKTISVRLRAYAGTSPGSANGFGSQTVVVTDTWQTVTITGTLPATFDGFSVLCVNAVLGEWTVSNGDYVEGDALQTWISTTTPAQYYDGDTLAGGGYTYAWSGTAHASESVRYPDVALGDMWFDIDDGQAYRWNGLTWQIIEDSSIAAALAAAQGAQTTADGKITAYYQTTPPGGLPASDAGDLWYDTDDGNKPYYWSGSAWVTIRDTTIATAHALAQTAVNDAAAANTAAGTANSAAIAAQATANAASAAAGVASTQATASNKVFRQAAAPSSNGYVLRVNDQWYDSDDGYRIRTWDGDSWEEITLGAATIADGSITATEIADDAITTPKLAANAITAKHTLTGPVVQTEATALRGIKMSSAGLIGYDTGGATKFLLTTAGNLSMTGNVSTGGSIDGAVVTGGTVQTEVTAARGIKLTSAGLNIYDAAGAATLVAVAATGAITMTGPILTGGGITGATVTGGTLQSEATAARGVKITSGGLTAYDGAGTPTFTITASTGALALTGPVLSGGTVTGATLQTEVTAARGVKMTTGGLFGYDGAGVAKFSLSTAGVLSVTGAVTSGGSIDGAVVTGGTIQSEVTAARGVKITSAGLNAYNSSGVATFTLTGSTGAIAMTGPVLTGGGITGATVTGGTMQSEVTAARGVKITSGGLTAYNGSGVATFTLTAATGAIAMTGPILTGGSLTAGTVQTEATASRGVKITTGGLTAYDSSGLATLTITAATGAIAMVGSLTSGSTISGATVTGSTITGGTFQTATTGERIIISSVAADSVQFQSGSAAADPVWPARIQSDNYLSGSDGTLRFTLSSARFTTYTGSANAVTTMETKKDAGGVATTTIANYASRFAVVAPEINIGATDTTQHTFMGSIKAVDFVKKGTTTVNIVTAGTNASGNVTFATPFPATGPVPAVMLTESGLTGNTTIKAAVGATSRSGFALNVVRSSGTGNTDIDWIAMAIT